MIRRIALALAVAGCAAKPPAPPGPFIKLEPPKAAPAPLPAQAATAAPAAAIRRDTAALESQVRGYVRRPDSKAETINELSTLLLQTRRAVGRMEANRRHGVFRTPDITAARVAADGLAAYLQTRTQEPPPAAAPAEEVPQIVVNPEEAPK